MFYLKTKKVMNVFQRMKAPTPKFFKVLRTIGLAVAAAGGALLAAPIALPAGIVALAGYLTVAGGVITTVSQAAVTGEENDEGGS
jgi:hypothetical protein